MTLRTTVAGPAARASVSHLLTALRRYPGPAAVLVAVIWLTWPLIGVRWRLDIAGCIVVLGVCGLAALRFLQPVLRSLRCRAKLWWVRYHWSELAISCGLSDERMRRSMHPAQNRVSVPRLHSRRTRWPRIRLTVRPLMGQTLTDFEDASERLRMAVGASHLRVEPSGVSEVSLTFTVGDGLTRAFELDDAANDDLRRVRMGLLDDGSPWYLPVGPHTLVAGCSGSGKGSLFWSYAFGLGPAVHAGRAQLHGIDLKGGMEVLMGKDLFTTYATSAAEAVVVLEQLVGRMQDRTRRYAGRVRSHEVTDTDPLHVVMIDELAALTAYCRERDLQRRAELAISLLCSQGRAPGFVVFACLQDPRKEVIPSRGLFTPMIGLRLQDLSETAMVLGEIALNGGALCHRISRAMPGMGYVVPEDGGPPIRVRAGFVSDEVIRQLSTAYASPSHLPVVVPATEQEAIGRLRSRKEGAGALRDLA
jgi:S-DNA-T family DNA segregation ATPase FtsK/SpoIIIE